MKTKSKRQKRWAEKSKKRVLKEIEKKEVKEEVQVELPDPSTYPRAIQPEKGKWRYCNHCEKMNPPAWTDPLLCVHCFRRLDGSERSKK